MKVAVAVAILCSLAQRGDASQAALGTLSAARYDHLIRSLVEYGGDGVAWMFAGDDRTYTEVMRVLGAHSILSKCEGSLAWWVEVRPEDARRAREALAADAATRAAVRPHVAR